MTRVLRTSHLGAPAVAAVSQGLGLLQYILLGLVSGFGFLSDTVFLFQSWMVLPGLIVIQGIGYPLWLRGSIGYFGRWGLTALAALFSCVAVISVGFWRFASAPDSETASFVMMLTLIAAIAGPLGAVALAVAVERSAAGFPMMAAAQTLPTSIFACAILPLALSDLTVKCFLLVASMALGWLVFLVAVFSVRQNRAGWSLSRMKEERREKAGLETVGFGIRSDIFWFGARSGSGYLAGTWLQSLGAALPPSAISQVSIVSKLVAGGTSVGVNSILPRLVHNRSAGTEGALALARVVSFGCVALGAVALPVAHLIGDGSWRVLFYVGLAWFLAGSVSACVQRVALRSMPPSSCTFSIVSAVFVVAAGSVLAACGLLSLLVLCSLFALLELLVAVSILLFLRRWIDVSILLFSIGLIVFGAYLVH